MIPEGVTQAVRTTVGLLVEGKFETLERMSQGQRLSADQMAEAIRNYGRNLVIPPEESFRNMNIVQIENQQTKTFSVDFPLWTAEEGQSDVEMRLTLQESMEGIYSVQVDDILVP